MNFDPRGFAEARFQCFLPDASDNESCRVVFSRWATERLFVQDPELARIFRLEKSNRGTTPLNEGHFVISDRRL
jgi:hypothetical protein